MRWLKLGWMVALVLAVLVPEIARADGPSGGARVQDALDQTDRRIALAETLVGENPNPNAQAELTAAHDLQARARSAFAANQLLLAGGATMQAREHADRAIAIVRNLPDPDRVQSQVERTQDVLDRARERLDGCDEPRARALLKVAMAMQERAQGAMAESRYLAALQLTTSAREKVQRAMRLCNLDESLADAAARALSRTDDVIGRSAELVGTDGSQASRDLLARAQTLQAQAHSEARLERYESALRLTLGARALAQRAARPLRAGRAVIGR